MVFPRDWPIQRLLAAMLVLLVILSLLPATLINAWDTSVLLTERSKRGIETAAHEIAEEIDARLGLILAWGADFSDRPAIRGWLEKGGRQEPDRKAVWEAEILLPFMRRHDLHGIFVATPDGRVLLGVGTHEIPGGRLDVWEPFRKASGGQRAISDVYAGRGGDPYYAVLVPIYNPRTSRLVAVLGVEDRQRNVRAILAHSARSLGERSFVVLSDAQGVRIAHGSDPGLEGVPFSGFPQDLADSYTRQGRFIRRGEAEPGWGDSKGTLRDAIVRAARDPGGAGFLRHQQARAGEPGYTFTLPLKRAPWVLAIGIPESAVHGPVNRQLARSAAILGLLIALAVALAMALGRWFTRPIADLMAVAERQAAGDLDARAEIHGHNELGRLAASFNRMADRLQGHARELEARVRERTAELASANAALQAQARELQAQTEELQAQTEELEAQRTELEEAYEALRRAEEVKARLFGGVSHDLRTPLQVIMGLASIMAESEDTNAFRDHVRYGERILAACHVLQGLIDDLLELSRIESGHLELHLDTVDYFGEVVTRSIELLRPLAEEKQQEIQFEPSDAPLPAVRIDLERMGRVLANLLGNAIKFTPTGGDIRIAQWIENDRVLTAVRDTGPGIPAEAQQHLFEPFYRVPGAQGPGIGLGLAIARQIVEAHGGRIGVESEVGRGTTLWFSLPAVRPEEETIPRPARGQARS